MSDTLRAHRTRLRSNGKGAGFESVVTGTRSELAIWRRRQKEKLWRLAVLQSRNTKGCMCTAISAVEEADE